MSAFIRCRNKYTKPCWRCKHPVAPGEGTSFKDGVFWKTEHDRCPVLADVRHIVDNKEPKR